MTFVYRAILMVALLAGVGTWANPFKGFVSVGDGRELFVRYLHNHHNSKTVVLVNGLTQDTEHWIRVVRGLHTAGFNILLYDTFHQGRSLLHWLETEDRKYSFNLRPVLPPLLGLTRFPKDAAPILPATPIESQARDLIALLDHFRIQDPVTLVGLSYGGGLALQAAALAPERFSDAILVAPYVAPIPGQDAWIRQNVPWFKVWFPHYSDDEVYDFLLRAMVLGTYQYSEPSIQRWGPYQVFAASELVRGIRQLNTQSLLGESIKTRLHLVRAGNDAYLPESLLNDFWSKVPDARKGTSVVVDGVEHKINESVGPWLAEWISYVIEKDLIPLGESLVAKPEAGTVQNLDGSWTMRMKKVSRCETLLLPSAPKGPALPVDRIRRNPAVEWLAYLRAYLTPTQRTWLDRWIDFWGHL